MAFFTPGKAVFTYAQDAVRSGVEFIVLDWETADGEERFIYVCHRCLSKGDYTLDKPTIPN